MSFKSFIISILIVISTTLCCVAEEDTEASSFWDRDFYIEISPLKVLENVPEREDQWYTHVSLVYEKRKLFKHYSTAFFVMPLIYRDPDKTITGVAAGLKDRIWLDPECERGLFLKIHIAGLYTNKKFIENGSYFNYASGIGLGYQWQNPDIFVHAGVEHISNGDRRSPNLGINSLGVTIAFFL